MIRFVMPLPPSVNRLWGNRPKNQKGRGRYPTKEYEEWKKAAGWEVRRQIGADGIRGQYRLQILVPTTMRGDISNRMKPIEDLLVALAVTPDDRFAGSVMCSRSILPKSGECRVSVYELTEEEKP